MEVPHKKENPSKVKRKIVATILALGLGTSLNACATISEDSWKLGVNCSQDNKLEVIETRQTAALSSTEITCIDDSGNHSAPKSIELIATNTNSNAINSSSYILQLEISRVHQEKYFNNTEPDISYNINETENNANIALRESDRINQVNVMQY